MTTNKPMKEDKEEVMYEKVLVRNRLPKIENRYYDTDLGKTYYHKEEKFWEKEVTWWLEPISLSSLLSEKDKQIESLELELKQIRQASEINQGVYQQNIQDLKSQLSQSGSKSGYGELLEWVDFQLSLFPTDGYLGAMKDIKEKILSLSSKEGSKAGFSEIEKVTKILSEGNEVDAHFLNSALDGLIEIGKRRKAETTPPTSKVEANITSDELRQLRLGRKNQEAKPSLQEGEKKTAEEYLENKENIFPSIQYNFKGKDIAEMMEEYNQFRSTDSKKAVEAKPMSIEECKDVVAKSYKQDNWKTFQKFCQDFGYVKMLDEAINEAITLYANQSK